MGIIEGSRVHWTDVYVSTVRTTTLYCQQHAKWEQGLDNNVTKNEVDTTHGCVQQ